MIGRVLRKHVESLGISYPMNRPNHLIQILERKNHFRPDSKNNPENYVLLKSHAIGAGDVTELSYEVRSILLLPKTHSSFPSISCFRLLTVACNNSSSRGFFCSLPPSVGSSSHGKQTAPHTYLQK